ncbi:hypothetical protein CYMTET_8590 [Cymbomonas tetramitiformis]|uniref:Uncharacterized protein n=1 Tax=Cymbomonas tetramitiformis TaxID=36881 RepID=A0AAE0LGC8_9CHLO|nr:hypothetical protein CYMTET_8590 [Cymbomonas tetramitiformis]
MYNLKNCFKNSDCWGILVTDWQQLPNQEKDKYRATQIPADKKNPTVKADALKAEYQGIATVKVYAETSMSSDSPPASTAGAPYSATAAANASDPSSAATWNIWQSASVRMASCAPSPSAGIQNAAVPAAFFPP